MAAMTTVDPTLTAPAATPPGGAGTSPTPSGAGTPTPGFADALPRAGAANCWSGTGGRANHIAIYMGDGKMMHSPRTGDVVKVDNIRSAPPTAIRRAA